ncbi:MAG: ABC transporter permease [Kiloniellaceae bacterium]
MQALLKRVDRPVAIAFGFIIVLLLAGSLYSSSFLSANYLLQQLQVAAFLGLIASGVMLVILLGHIDLSIPWLVTVGGMMSTAAAGWWGAEWAIPFGVFCGLVFGIVNGLGVAILRVPSMIFTLGINAVAQGIMVLHTGGFAPQDHATDLMHWLAVQRVILGIPNAVFIWALLGIAIVVMLKRTPLGRYIYAIGNREGATYLSGVNTKLVIITCFAISGMCSALAGVLLAGYSSKGYQAMGDPYLLPAIAAVVLGGTHILGGRGSYLGTIAGVILISLLASILSVMQMPEAGRQIIYGCVIVGMLMVYGRGQKVLG